MGVAKKPTKKVSVKKSKTATKFFIDCRKPIEDGIMNAADFETFLSERIKVRTWFRLGFLSLRLELFHHNIFQISGKTGQLGASSGVVLAVHDKTKVGITANVPFSKR